MLGTAASAARVWRVRGRHPPARRGRCPSVIIAELMGIDPGARGRRNSRVWADAVHSARGTARPFRDRPARGTRLPKRARQTGAFKCFSVSDALEARTARDALSRRFAERARELTRNGRAAGLSSAAGPQLRRACSYWGGGSGRRGTKTSWAIAAGGPLPRENRLTFGRA